MSERSMMYVHIPDLASGLAFLARLPLADYPAAEQGVIHFLDALLAKPLPGKDLFLLAEKARPTISRIEEEMACLYHGHPLPLADAEEQAFQRVIDIWQKLEQIYVLSLNLGLPDEDSPNYAHQTATLLHRCMYCRGMLMLEHYRARHELPAGAWLALHAYYARAEKLGVETAPIVDELDSPLHSSHCTAAYVTLLLIEIASPYSHSVHNLNLIRTWADLWAPLVSVHALDDEELPSYFVELLKDAPLHQLSNSDGPGGDARRLDTTRLGLQINHMLGQLHMQIKPSQLGLGEETGSLVIALLNRLIRPWTQSASPRKFRRFAANGSARVAQGFAAMYAHIAGQVFEQPEQLNPYSKQALDRLFIFGEQAGSISKKAPDPAVEFPLDEWLVINHSASGFRLARSGHGARVAHTQLMAILPHDGENFLLCRVGWLMEESDASLMAGFAVLPGLPQGIIVRHAGTTEGFTPAFLMPVLPLVKEEGSLVLPPGLYLPRKVLEVLLNGEKLQLRMLEVIERGADYERIRYEPA